MHLKVYGWLAGSFKMFCILLVWLFAAIRRSYRKIAALCSSSKNVQLSVFNSLSPVWCNVLAMISSLRYLLKLQHSQLRPISTPLIHSFHMLLFLHSPPQRRQQLVVRSDLSHIHHLLYGYGSRC